eukprot:364201-Chlamydomonas_euryale.AAC.23
MCRVCAVRRTPKAAASIQQELGRKECASEPRQEREVTAGRGLSGNTKSDAPPRQRQQAQAAKDGYAQRAGNGQRGSVVSTTPMAPAHGGALGDSTRPAQRIKGPSECKEELFAPSCCRGTPSGVNSVVDLPPTVPSYTSSKIAARALECQCQGRR